MLTSGTHHAVWHFNKDDVTGAKYFDKHGYCINLKILIPAEAGLTGSDRGRQSAHVEGGSPVVPLCARVLELWWLPIRQETTPEY